MVDFTLIRSKSSSGGWFVATVIPVSSMAEQMIWRKKKEQCGEDIISKLPEELLIYILSLLPKPLDAIRTCILSKRWKHLWVFLPNLYFTLPFSFWSAERVKTFQDSVDNALALRDGMLVRRFFLTCYSQKYDYDRVLNSLSIAAQSKIEILELNFPTKNNKLRLSWDFLKACSTTLVELTLKGVCVLDVPQAGFLFPCLKQVKLTSLDYLGDQSPQNLVSRCPVLQELCFEKQSFHSPSKNAKIASPYLKRLRIPGCFFDSEVLIDAPRLEYFYINDVTNTKYSLTNPLLSIVEAHIDIFSDTIVEFLTSVSAVKRLTLNSMSICAIDRFHNNNVPTMFPNLSKLGVDIGPDSWNLLFNLLNKMPLLEQLTIISYGNGDITVDHTTEAPTCLRFKMKEIVIRNGQFVTQLFLIEYLLRHSTTLERLTLNAHTITHETREQLLNFARGSNMCRIELV